MLCNQEECLLLPAACCSTAPTADGRDDFENAATDDQLNHHNRHRHEGEGDHAVDDY